MLILVGVCTRAYVCVCTMPRGVSKTTVNQGFMGIAEDQE